MSFQNLKKNMLSRPQPHSLIYKKLRFSKTLLLEGFRSFTENYDSKSNGLLLLLNISASRQFMIRKQV